MVPAPLAEKFRIQTVGHSETHEDGAPKQKHTDAGGIRERRNQVDYAPTQGCNGRESRARTEAGGASV